MQTKFAIYNFSGKPVSHFLVDAEDVAKQAQVPVQAPSHHIVLVDASGSMWNDMDPLKSNLEKVFTLEEFSNPSMRISLLSFSSSGDCKLHFTRQTVADVMAPNSQALQEIRSLRTRGMTGISQALAAAEKLIEDKETTCISLHTDGYANDPSPYSEAQNVNRAVDAISKHPKAFCNTLAYRDYCDFSLLSSIANKLAGKCLQVKDIRQVYQALHDTSTLLAGQLAPEIEAGIGDYDFITFMSRTAKKVLGGTDSLTVKGLAPDDDKTVYRYRKVDQATFEASPSPLDESYPLMAYARTQVALGNLNLAKYAMISTRNQAFRGHFRALVGSEIAAMVADLERYLFESLTCGWSKEYGLGLTGPTVLEVLGVLQQYQGSLKVNLQEMSKSYRRRGLKRLAGTRDAEGKLVKPAYKLQTPRDKTEVAVSGIEFNRNTASANIRFSQKATLIETASGTPIEKVAGIELDLREFNNYTLIGDGSVNVTELPIRTSDKRCFAALKNLALVTGEFNPEAEILLDFSHLAVVDFDQDFAIPVGTFNDLAELTVLQKILSGLVKDAAPAYSTEQVQALKDHCLSTSLYFNAPTCNPYTELKDAITNGEVDTRTGYKVELGTSLITNLGKFKSGNEALQRRFTYTGSDGKEVEKPTLPLFLQTPRGTWGIKTLSAKTKLDVVDQVTFSIYADFLGLESNGSLAGLLSMVGWDSADLNEVLEVIQGKVTGDPAVELMTKLRRAVDSTIDRIYQEKISPLVMYVGATGLIPDSFNAKAMTAEQLVDKYPRLSLSKAEKEDGVFYELPGDHLLTVYTSSEYFSTERGLSLWKESE